MITTLITHTTVLSRCLAARVRPGPAGRRDRHGDDGSTLEVVIIVLGVMALAGMLVAAITAAVTRRTDQIR